MQDRAQHDTSEILTQLAVAHQKLVEIGRDIAGIKSHLVTLNGKVGEHAMKFAAREAIDKIQDVARGEMEKTLNVLSEDQQQREGASRNMNRIVIVIGLSAPFLTALFFFALNRVFPTAR